MNILEKRGRALNDLPIKKGPVIYWLSRDQRANDNWAILAASEIALKSKEPLIVVFSLVNDYLGASPRQYDFMIKGLEELDKKLASYNIPFQILLGKPEETIVKFAKKYSAGIVITDFSPLRLNRQWKKEVAKNLNCAFFEVDAHNIIPAWLVSPKQEYGAYTIRPKINRLLEDYLIPFSNLKKQQQFNDLGINNDYHKIYSLFGIKKEEENIRNIFIPGEMAAKKAMNAFLKNNLSGYDVNRNDPNKNAQSNLSPYLHFGHLSAQRLALEAGKSLNPKLDREAFLEELIVRRELADNFCLYNENYDNPQGFPDWAKRSTKKHENDKREYLYSKKILETARTHDSLWNTAQVEMIKTGKMHGYMRMYWAKKILEWTKSAEEAMKIAIYLNDKYQLDGRDPNGYAGVAWSIGGVHDRAWFERPVFGQVRYMNENGCRRKFNVDEYIAKWIV